MRLRLGLTEDRRSAGSRATERGRAGGHYAERIVLRDAARVHVLPVAQFDYVEAQDDYLAFHSGAKSFLKQQTISSLEQSLDPGLFVRVALLVRGQPGCEPTKSVARTRGSLFSADGAKIPVEPRRLITSSRRRWRHHGSPATLKICGCYGLIDSLKVPWRGSPRRCIFLRKSTTNAACRKSARRNLASVLLSFL